MTPHLQRRAVATFAWRWWRDLIAPSFFDALRHSFGIGIYGVLSRRNILGILMSIELMFNAANIIWSRSFIFFIRATLGPRLRHFCDYVGGGRGCRGVIACFSNLPRRQKRLRGKVEHPPWLNTPI